MPPAATHANHHRVIQKTENSNGKNSRTAEQRATEEADDVVVCSVTALVCGPGRHFQVNWRIGKTAHSTRTEIIEAVADNTIRFQQRSPSIWLRCLLPSRSGVRCKTAFVCCREAKRPALGGWPLVSSISGTAASTMSVRLQKENYLCFIPCTRPIASTEYRATDCLQKIYFFPCSSRWAFTASSACPLP